jgi:hypothetical protein
MTVRRTIMTDSSPYSRQEIEQCNEVDDDEQNDDCSGWEGEWMHGPWGKWGQLGKGGRGGPDPPSEEQDKQLICDSGGDETLMGEPGGQQDGSDTASRTHHAQGT